MNILIDIPKEYLDTFAKLADKKKWSRKKYIEWVLNSFAANKAKQLP